MALMEAYVPGRTDNLHDYLIPTIGDAPEIECLLIEDAEPARAVRRQGRRRARARAHGARDCRRRSGTPPAPRSTACRRPRRSFEPRSARLASPAEGRGPTSGRGPWRAWTDRLAAAPFP